MCRLGAVACDAAVPFSSLNRGDECRLHAAGVGGEQAVAQAAVDTLACFAIVAAQLDERLAGERVVATYASPAEHRHDAVLFGTDILEQGDGTVGHLVVVSQFATGIIEWGDRVDEHDVNAAVTQGAARSG